MTVPVIAFFNNKGGVGKTSLVYHVAWMLAEQGYRILAADLDPQGNLTAAFLDGNRLEGLWSGDQEEAKTIYRAIHPLKDGTGDVASSPKLEGIDNNFSLLPGNLALLPGDMSLSQFEDDLSDAWPKCLDEDPRAFRVMSAFWRVLQNGANEHLADAILVDLGPNLGAINRAALIASDYVVIPLGPDLFSLQGLRNLGPTLKKWRKGWKERFEKNPTEGLKLPPGDMNPLGYIVMQHSVRHDQSVKSYDRWIARIPDTYREFVLNESTENVPLVADDPHCFALVKHYRSLMAMAQEAHKPLFLLKSADGALGAHTYAVKSAYDDFKSLSLEIVKRAGITINRSST